MALRWLLDRGTLHGGSIFHFPIYQTLSRGATMKSKLLRKKSYCLNNSREGRDGQWEMIEGSSEPWKQQETARPGQPGC
jgi:hypothetical protein